MIRYALLCPEDHGFEAWFRDSDGFDSQRAAGQVCCPACGRSDVRKAVMAPAVRRPAEKRGTPAVAPAAPANASPKPVPMAGAPSTGAPPSGASLADVPFARLREALREIHAKLKRDAVDVGPAFPEQARAIHDGAVPPRAIYGTATDDEVRGLVEDGVAILPIPALPDDRN